MSNNPGWILNPNMVKQSIDENGMLSSTPSFMCLKENDAIKEMEKRAKKYLENGNKTPPGNRFFLLSPEKNRMIMSPVHLENVQ